MNKPIGILVACAVLSIAGPCAARADPDRPPVSPKAQQFINKYKDPEGRKQLREEALAKVRKDFAGFDRKLGLDAVTFESFVQLRADQEVALGAVFLVCGSSSDPACDTPGKVREYYEGEQRDITALLGANGYQAMQKWVRGGYVRMWVDNLARRVPAGQPITEAQSEALVEAYVAEQKIVSQEYEALGKKPLPYSNDDWMELIYDGSVPELSERMASARNYTQRIRNRAAGILSVEQLVVFEQMQDELLRDLERYQRNTSYRKYEGQPTITDAPAPLAAASAAPAPAIRWKPEEFLRKYKDPAGRSELLAAATVDARRYLEGFDKKSNLDAATFEKLVRLTAEQELERRALQFRCPAFDGGCNASAEYRAMLDRNRRDVTNLLGARGYETSQDWIHMQDERRVVSNLAQRMPKALSLSNEQSAKLVRDLEDEQVKVFGDAARNHKLPVPFSNTDGMELMYDYKAASLEERMASARNYSQRMRTHASTVLQGAQYSVFDQLQEKLLADLQRYLQSDASKRRAKVDPKRPEPLAIADLAAGGPGDPTSPPPGSREWTEELFRVYHNPDSDESRKLRAEELAFARRRLKGFDEHRKLDAATFEKVVQLSADQAVEKRTVHSRCNGVIEPVCNAAAESEQMRRRHEQAMDAVFGTGMYEDAETWSYSRDERRLAARLAGRMPANLPLTDSQSAALIKALFKEQLSYYGDVTYAYPYFSPNGVTLMYPYLQPSADERMDGARSYSKRMRDRAATVLSSGQLAILNQMHDEALSELELQLRKLDTQQKGS